MLSATHVPSVSELLPAANGEGLLLQGYGATWDLDRVGDVFNPYSLDRTVKQYLAQNPVLLYQHKVNMPPVGKVLKAEIHRDKGLWIEAVLPKPQQSGTFASEIWDAAKAGLLRALSVGGKWYREDRGTHQEIVDADIREISICPVAVNAAAHATAVVPTEAKAIGDDWVPASEYDEALQLQNMLTDLALAEMRLDVAAMKLGRL